MNPLLRQFPVLIGLLVSVVAHAWLFVPMLAAMLRGPVLLPISSVALTPAPADTAPRVQLGIEQSPAATLAWVGYDTYEEHLARLSEQDQAAFELDPGHPAPLRRQPMPPTATTQTPSPPTYAPSLQSILAELSRRMMPNMPQVATSEHAAALPRIPASDLPTVDEIAIALPPPSSEPATVSDTAPPDAPARPDSPGEEADKQSDPTSTIETPLDNIRIGKPLAAAGLELFPRRPDFTTLQRMSAWPANPLCLIQFDATGTPRHATLLEGTGDGRIDDALLASLYSWRAKGPPLEALNDPDTIDVTIRIVLR